MRNLFLHRISLVLNVVLIAVAVVLAVRRSKPAASSVPVQIVGAKPKPLPVETKLPQFTKTESAASQRRWLIDQLRAMGVPNHILARIAQEDLLTKWNTYATGVTLKVHGDPATMAALQLEIDERMDSDMRAALGEEGFKEWDRQNMLREADPGNIPLTGAESDAAYALWKKLQLRELAFKEARVKRTMDDAEIEDEHTKAMAEYDQQMKLLLGAERYAQSRQSDDATTAAGLQQDLAAANPSNSQFQSLLSTQSQLNERRAAIDKQFQGDTSSAAYAEQIKALNDARDQEYERVLGPAAFDALQKSQDPSYAQMKKNETLWGLDDSNIDSVYGTIKYYQKVVQEYESQTQSRVAQGQNVDWDAVNGSLKQFSDQTMQSLKDYLGADRFNRLKQNGVFQLNVIPHH